MPPEIILLGHVQREKFTFTIVHSVSNISLDAYSYLKHRRKIARVLEIQFYFIFHFKDTQLWYKMVSLTWVFKDMKIRLTRSFIIFCSISLTNRLCGRKLFLHCFGKITSSKHINLIFVVSYCKRNFKVMPTFTLYSFVLGDFQMFPLDIDYLWF